MYFIPQVVVLNHTYVHFSISHARLKLHSRIRELVDVVADTSRDLYSSFLCACDTSQCVPRLESDLREYFQSSTQNMMVHQYFSGDSEINLLRKIFLKVGSIQINMPNGYEKLEPLLNSASGARSQGNGTAPTTTPSTTTAAANNLANSVVESHQHPPPSSSSWPTTLASSTHNGVSSNADAWLTSSSVAPSSSAANNNVFSFPTASSSNSNDFLRWSTSTPISDVWSNSSLLPSHQNPPPSAPGTFNRAPSRPESSTSPPKTNGSGANNTQVDYTSPFFTPPSSSSADIDEMLNQRKFF